MLLDLSSYVVGRLLLAALLGGVVGLERELRHKPAGLRTIMLISLGAALFTIISSQMASNFGGDHTRIAAQIIPGIGFIGAGVVIRERGTIMGITSAATIFVIASIGMASWCGNAGHGRVHHSAASGGPGYSWLSRGALWPAFASDELSPDSCGRERNDRKDP